jgi:hypothetical protein
MTLWGETLLAGIIVAVVGTIVAGTVGKLFKVDLPPVCKEWNRNYTMEISLFVTGAVAHLLRVYFA